MEISSDEEDMAAAEDDLAFSQIIYEPEETEETTYVATGQLKLVVYVQLCTNGVITAI